jgi:hypothetical protein
MYSPAAAVRQQAGVAHATSAWLEWVELQTAHPPFRIDRTFPSIRSSPCSSRLPSAQVYDIRIAQVSKEVPMCTGNVGVARRIDLESISEDIARLVKELDNEVEGEVKVHELKNIGAKLDKIVKG